MSPFYIKIVVGVVAGLLVISGVVYVNRLRSTIEFQKAALVSAKSIIEEQKQAIITLTEEKKEFEYRLQEALKKQAEIKSSVNKRLEKTPPVPVDCKPQVQWLKKRAVELKQDQK